jgi:beta-mannosidase
VRVVQKHAADGSARGEPVETVTLHLTPELARKERGATCRYRLTLNRIVVAEGTGTEIVVTHPQLWWPNGHGAQPLYLLEVEVSRADGTFIGSWLRPSTDN